MWVRQLVSRLHWRSAAGVMVVFCTSYGGLLPQDGGGPEKLGW